MDTLQSDDLLSDHHAIGTSSTHHLYHHVQNDVIRCPHHVALPDSERGSDRDLHNRTSFQVSGFFLFYFLFRKLFSITFCYVTGNATGIYDKDV